MIIYNNLSIIEGNPVVHNEQWFIETVLIIYGSMCLLSHVLHQMKEGHFKLRIEA